MPLCGESPTFRVVDLDQSEKSPANVSVTSSNVSVASSKASATQPILSPPVQPSPPRQPPRISTPENGNAATTGSTPVRMPIAKWSRRRRFLVVGTIGLATCCIGRLALGDLLGALSDSFSLLFALALLREDFAEWMYPDSDPFTLTSASCLLPFLCLAVVNGVCDSALLWSVCGDCLASFRFLKSLACSGCCFTLGSVMFQATAVITCLQLYCLDIRPYMHGSANTVASHVPPSERQSYQPVSNMHLSLDARNAGGVAHAGNRNLQVVDATLASQVQPQITSPGQTVSNKGQYQRLVEQDGSKEVTAKEHHF